METENDGFRAVKMSLNQFCTDASIKERINEFVLNSNKLMWEAYAFANLHITRLLRENKAIPKLDQTFFQHCCLFVSEIYEKKAKKPRDTEMTRTFTIYSSLRQLDYKPAFRDYTYYIISYIAKDMIVASQNHLVLNFYKRFTKYLKSRYGYSKERVYEIAKGVYEESYRGDDVDIVEWRGKLGDKPPYEKHIKKDPTSILKIYDLFLTHMINHNKDKKSDEKMWRTFSLLPNKNGFTMSNITIDKSVLMQIIGSFKRDPARKNVSDHISSCNSITAVVLKKDFEDNSSRYWGMFFDIDKVKDFAGIIKTDGSSVSVMSTCQ